MMHYHGLHDLLMNDQYTEYLILLALVTMPDVKTWSMWHNFSKWSF